MLIAFSRFCFYIVFNVYDIAKFFIFIQDSLFHSFFSIIGSNSLCSGKSLLIFTSKSYVFPMFNFITAAFHFR